MFHYYVACSDARAQAMFTMDTMTILATFSAVILLTISNSGLLFIHNAVTGFSNSTFTVQLITASTPQPVTL